MASGRSARADAFEAAMTEAGRYLAAGNTKSAFEALERAHVLGQLDFRPHLRVHWQMLRIGWKRGDRREVLGQLMRIALVPIGHLLGRLPVGNTGGANVSAFQPMDIARAAAAADGPRAMTGARTGMAEQHSARPAARGRWWLLMGMAALLFALDQGVKWIVATNLLLGDRIALTSWFNLVHVLNPGASFSILADAGGWQRHALSALGIVVSLVLAVLLWRGVRSRLETAAYVGLIGGALGNVADRLRIGAVVDYLDLHWREMHWPAFNLADIFIVGSAGLLVLASFGPRADSRGADREEGAA